ncbi:MAG: phosphonate metabolism protein/1,5-bisphosphokinase (PRPP-forming) PhnN [Aliishimia sp.]
MTGRFIAVVGPSGVGKDSLMEALVACDPRFVLARRVITRPIEAGGEAYDGVTDAEFETRKGAGEFALSWPAHGLSYAIPASVDAQLANGKDVLANLSRSKLTCAHARFARFEVINLTATQGILAKRLAARGRETAAQIETRLDRVTRALPTHLTLHSIDNSGALSMAVNRVIACLYSAPT